MRAFSVRHRDGLADKSLVIELNSRTRGRIRRLIENHDYSYEKNDQWDDLVWASHTDELTRKLYDLYGQDTLPSPKGPDLKSLIEGGMPGYVFDAVELYMNELSKTTDFPRKLNDILRDERVPWRMLDGTMVLLDSQFARDELSDRATRSLEAAGFDGALGELRDGRNDIAAEDLRGAIHNAGKAQESVMKALLSRTDGGAKELAQELRQAGHFDGLPDGLSEPFISKVLESVSWMRNKLGGHGQGAKAVELPRAYAELALDLASAQVHFLLALREEKEGAAEETDVPLDTSEFVAASTTAPQDDDIPF